MADVGRRLRDDEDREGEKLKRKSVQNKIFFCFVLFFWWRLLSAFVWCVFDSLSLESTVQQYFIQGSTTRDALKCPQL